jgi:hypothetical protein
MKKTALIVGLCLVFVLGSVLSMAATTPVSASSGSCPGRLEVGQCLTDIPGMVQIEDVQIPTGYYREVDTEWTPDRWLFKVAVTVPDLPVLFWGMNLNNFHLELVGLFVDQRLLANPPANEGEFFDSTHVFVRLVCDQQGSMEPTLTFSIPKQYVTLADGTSYHRIPRAGELDVINFVEAMTTACNY